jgi:hypothetical protein
MRYRIFILTLFASIAFVGPSEAQHLTPQQRAQIMQQQRVMDVERQAYYARERRMDSVARGLRTTSRIGEAAGIARFGYIYRGAPGTSVGQYIRNDRARAFTRDVARDGIYQGIITRGTQYGIQSNRRLNDLNARMWGYR